MKNRKGIKLATVAASLAFVAPLWAATPDSTLQHSGYSALSSLDNEYLVSLSNAEMDDIKGGFFDMNFLSGFNIAVMPQINICVICFGTNQSNYGSIMGFNFFP